MSLAKDVTATLQIGRRTVILNEVLALRPGEKASFHVEIADDQVDFSIEFAGESPGPFRVQWDTAGNIFAIKLIGWGGDAENFIEEPIRMATLNDGRPLFFSFYYTQKKGFNVIHFKLLINPLQ